MWGEIIGSGIDAIANTNITQQQNETNKEIAQMNLDFQRENLDYQKALQQQIFERADTSYQRTVEDMRKAGLNPLAMNGTNETGGAIQTEAQHNDYTADYSGYMNTVSNMIDTMEKIQNYETGKNFDREQKAKADITEENAKIAKINSTLEKATIQDKIKMSNLNREEKEKLMKDLDRNMEYNEANKLYNGMPEDERTARILSGVTSNTDEKEHNIEREALARLKKGLIEGAPIMTNADSKRKSNEYKEEQQQKKAEKQKRKNKKR